jgi:hypothetical protein
MISSEERERMTSKKGKMGDLVKIARSTSWPQITETS